ncbi:MAG TPA: hypothetical protein VFY28_03195 [Candidatus Paceibacterota bacterium]|nr:hypothetical protein [Candidatus Paceibacterota bacterium]
MTWKHHRIWIIALLVVSGIALAWVLASTPDKVSAPGAQNVSPTTSDLTGRAIYTNGEYGFSIAYPETARLEESFSPDYRLTQSWRASALATGSPIVAIVAYSTASDHSYPRNFTALVRIGASGEPREVTSCLSPTPNQNETSLPDADISGTKWKAFSFENAGAMQYVRGVSYRTLHEGKCIALEKIQTGSSYRDDPDSPDDIPDETLQARYKSLDAIVESFAFARL